MATDLSNLTPETPGSFNFPFSKGSTWGGATAAKILEGLYGADVAWTAPTLLGTWVNYGAGFRTTRYTKRAGTVFIEGVVKNGAFGTAVFNLPEGCRPTDDTLMLATFAYASSTFQTGRFDVQTGGDVKAVVPLSGTAQYFNIAGSFFVGA